MGHFLTTIFLMLFIKKISSGVKPIHIKESFKLHNKYSIISLAANFLGTLMNSADILIINYFIKDRLAIGYYSFALIFITGLIIFTRSVMQITNPYFSEISGDFNKWLNRIKKYDRLLIITSIIITSASIIVVPLFLKFAFNGKYINSIIYFEILVIAWFFKNLVIIKASALFGLGKININTLVDLISLPIYISINIYRFVLL